MHCDFACRRGLLPLGCLCGVGVRTKWVKTAFIAYGFLGTQLFRGDGTI